MSLLALPLLTTALAGAASTVTDAVEGLRTPSAVRGAVVECAWSAAHLALYPWGIATERAAAGVHVTSTSLSQLPPHRRGLLVSDPAAAGTPILLVHGMVDNRSIFTVLRRGLRRRGFDRVATMNYGPWIGDVRDVAERLADEVERLCAETGYERVHVVGHSLGGLVARVYVQLLGGSDRVHTLVTLGSPHGGSRNAHLLPGRLGRSLRPGSELLQVLATPAPGCRTRFVAVWSDLDQMVLPHPNARIEHPDLRVRNVLVRGVGHMSLPVDARVVHDVGLTLAHLDADGTTLTAGAASLPATA
ncbi:MAG: esterase/lipase family protein [Actinomycetes bacterium]